jgi:DNA polymerase II small subunit
MDAKEILRFCMERGFLIDNESFDILNEVDDIETVKILIEKIGEGGTGKIITKSLFLENKERLSDIISNLPTEKRKITESLKIKLGLSIEISKESISESKEFKKKPVYVKGLGEVKQLSGNLNMQNPGYFEKRRVKVISNLNTKSKKVEVRDFVNHFRGRFNEMRKLIQNSNELTNLVSIDKIYGNRQGISLIGMVLEKRITKNKNLLLVVEDSTGRISAIVNQNKPEIFQKAEDIALDSVIGLKCSGNKEIVFVNDIVFPDTALFERKKSPIEEYALFTGDMHIGSDRFMEKNFLRFVDYLNGEIKNTPETSKIKYLVLCGDLIAGVGEYPGQEKDLIIGDVEGQYEVVAKLLGKINKNITIVITPGNHDAVRLMEPQPLLDEKYAWPIYDMDNVVMSTNPGIVNLGEVKEKNFSGYELLIYHGFSYHYYGDAINSLRQIRASRERPDRVMSYLLKNRHLAPTHASNVYCPSESDPLIIKNAPDIFFSGHTHKSAVSYYNNILIISSSSWETKTPYQEKLGNEPDFCKVPMFNLKTRAIKILDFE